MFCLISIFTFCFVTIYGNEKTQKRRDRYETLPDTQYNILAQSPVYVANESVHWIEYGPNIYTKLYYVEPVTGRFVTLMKAAPVTFIGTHRHHGTVLGYTLAGKWGYIEHEKEWLSTRGDLVFETPGSVHTLFVSTDSEEDALILFIMDGSLEFLDEYGNSLGYLDWR
eukprot:253471_1